MWRIWRLILLAVISIYTLCISQAYSSWEEETYFVVTAYYSPLPGQSQYLNGSYEREIIMNWKGTHWASWKEVFQGMIAAPRNYPFGTKIYFEWYWIGEVQDRGGAIVEAGERGHSYDRIDIWMWYGDEWLQRAKIWGIRTIKWKIVVPSSPTTIEFWESKLGHISDIKVGPESESDEIKKLQEVFTLADLYDGEIDGKYTSIEMELIEFQIASWIIKDKEDWGAWYFGNKTLAALRKKYGIESPLVEEANSKFSEFNHRIQSQKYKIILDYGELEITPESSEENIKSFQQMMTELWEYSGEIDGKYSSIEEFLINLQKKIGVITNRDDWGAGYFGDKTKTALWEYYGNTSLETPKISLSVTQKNKLDITIVKLRTAIEKIAKKQGKTSQQVTDKLKSDINKTLPSITHEILKLKLEYIEKNL